ncbi:MAG TPA: CFI-box-CTERM domain-containing protein [Nitrososphaera sp.]|nr:CFI-box-CTERM domain-containing protein [Nitrososphaera sp.]
MRGLLAIAAIVMMTLLTSSLLTSQHVATAEGSFSFQNETKYLDETKILHIYGEIKNESTTAAMKNVLITASFYDANGTLLSQSQQAPKLRVINPGNVAPFDMVYLDSASVGRVASYSLSATGQPTEIKPAGLTIVSSNSRLDVLGLYYINVDVRNDGNQTVTNPIAIATLYDSAGKVVAIGEAPLESESQVVGNMTVGDKGGAGIVVAERLQTYKTASYALVADSDQYVSSVSVHKAAGLGASASTPSNSTQKSGCLIATAAFGSELAPQVQELRDFRDGLALRTMAGSSFMDVFNGWYYSFSPQVADYERGQGWLRSTVRTSVYPLLGILDLSTSVFQALSFNGEAAIVGAGLIASSLIGLVYFAPLSAVLIVAGRKKHWDAKRATYALAIAWAISVVAVAIGEASSSNEALMVGTALLVLSAISTVIIAVTRAVRL